MNIWYAVVGDTGEVFTKGHVSGSGIQVLKQLLCALHSGETKLDAVDALFTEHLLDAHTPAELVKWIADLDEDDPANDILGLFEVADEPGEFWANVLNLLTSAPGTDHEEVTETQTTLLVKLA